MRRRQHLIHCAVTWAAITGCSSKNSELVDGTMWSTTHRLGEVRELAISNSFGDRFERHAQEYARERLDRNLIERGFTVNENARYHLRADFRGPWTGSRGVPISSRFTKVSIEVSLEDREQNVTLLKGQADGVIDEGDVNLFDSSGDQRLNAAIDSAIGKLGRQMSYARVLSEDSIKKAKDFLPVGERQSLAVIDFKASGGVSSEEAKALSDICRNTVSETQKFRLIDRANMRSLLGEQDFAAVVECDETTCLVTYGKILHAQKMIHGRVSKLGASFLLYVEIVDVNTSVIDATSTGTVVRVEAFADLVPVKTLDLIETALALQEQSGQLGNSKAGIAPSENQSANKE